MAFSMDETIITKQKCESEYTMDHGSTSTTFICTALILFFTLFLELAVHSYMNCCNTIEDDDSYTIIDNSRDEMSHEALLPTVVVEQPRPDAAPRHDLPQDTSQPDASDPDSEPAQKKPPPPPDCCTCCVPNPPPNVRANRLIAAVFLYAVVLAAFIIRMRSINDPYIRPACQRFVGKDDIPGPSWWAVGLLNILPLCFASLSMLRTVVDCFLVRWGRSLKYIGQDGVDDWTTWPPCMSSYLIFVCIREASRWPITLLMGMPRSSAASRHSRRSHMEEDVEMGGEEMSRLAYGADDEDSEHERDGASPPAYNDAVNGQEGVGRGPSKGR